MSHEPDWSTHGPRLAKALEVLIGEWFDEETMADDPFWQAARAALAALKEERR